MSLFSPSILKKSANILFSKTPSSSNDSVPHQEPLRTLALAAFGTWTAVALHHRYRKRQQPNAKWHDYMLGVLGLRAAAMPTLKRLQYTTQQARWAWQQSDKQGYQQYHKPADNTPTVNAHTSSQIISTLLVGSVCWVSGVAAMPKSPRWMAAEQGDDVEQSDDFGVVGIDANRQLVWQTTMPERVHDIVVQPVLDAKRASMSRDVVVMGRRPSAHFWVLNTTNGQLQAAITADNERHFYGHACYSLDGQRLYVTENDTRLLVGKIGIYAVANGYKKIAEFDSHGIGPHELMMHPDGDTLIVANGGIKTEYASREELNLDTMRPSLVYLNRYDGTLLQQISPEYNQMSIRHMAIHNDGTVMIGIQFQGEKHLNVPLVLTHQRGEAHLTPLLMPNNQWQRFHQYIASVAVDSRANVLCVTTPIGGCAALFDLDTRKLIEDIKLPDCAGVAILNQSNPYVKHDNDNAVCAGFMVSDGQGQLTTLCVPKPLQNTKPTDDTSRQALIIDSHCHKMSFDNHLQAL